MPMYKLKVYPDCGYKTKTLLVESPNIDEAERFGCMARDQIDRDAMYDVEEITGISKIFYRALMRRNAWLPDM